MAVSSQKFLPSGKSGSLAVMPAAKLAMIRKPLVTTSSDGEAKKTFVDIHKKVTSLTFIFRKSRILTKKIIRRKRKSAEIEENRKREEKLEERKNSRKKDTKNDSLLVTPPGGNIIDSLTRFAGFTLLGFVVDKYSNLLPKLIEFGKTIQPAVEIFGSFAKNLVGNTITFIERGYQAYDAVNDIVKKLGGENYERIFGQFSGALNMFLQAALLTGVAGFGGGLLKPKFLGVEAGGGAGALGAGTLDQQLKRAKQYFSKYSFRTVKETAPIGSARITNALSRTILGLPMAKDLPTRKVLKENKRFAIGYQSQKQSYTSTTDKAVAKFIQEGATDKTNQALRKAGIGVIDDAPARNVRRNVLREMGFGNFVGPNEPLTPSTPSTVRKSSRYAKPVSSTKILGQSFGSEIARLKKSYMKLGFSNSDLISIANDIDGKSYLERKAAYDLLDRKGLSGRVTNVPTLDLPRPVNRTSQGILRNQQIGAAPSIPKPGEGIIPTPQIKQRGILGRGVGRAGQRAALKVGGKAAAKFVGRIPVIGPLIDFVVSIALGDDPGEAAAGAVGAALGGFVGGALAGAGTFGLGALVGGAVGGFVGDLIVRSLYQAAKSYVFKPKSYASGGQVTRGGVARGAVSRDIKTNIKDIKAKKIQTVTPQQTVVGKNAYLGESKEGDKMISNYQKIYGEAGLRALKDSSRDVKKIKFMQNIWGALGGAYIDMLLGQRPDSSLASDIGSIIGAMTNERHGRKVSQELSISLENSANNIFRHLYAAAGVERPAMDTKFGNRAPSPDGTQADVRGIDAKGEVIGYVGYTGNVRPKGPDGAHIHIETGMGRGGAGGAIPASVLKNIIVGGKPLSDWPRTSGIGMRESGMHYGLDYGIPAGTPITLSGGLKFVEYAAGENAGYGNLVVVSDGAGNKYLLGHLSGGPPNPEALKKKETVAPVKKVSSSGLNQQTSYELAIHERSVYFYQQETVLA